MDRQSQWLFEAPFVLESDRHTNLYPNSEYYSDSECEAEGNLWGDNIGEREVFIPCENDPISGQDSKFFWVSFHVEFQGFLRAFERAVGKRLNELRIEQLRRHHQRRLAQGIRSGDKVQVGVILYFTGKGNKRRICDIEVFAYPWEK
jgi:hypothetical protein